LKKTIAIQKNIIIKYGLFPESTVQLSVSAINNIINYVNPAGLADRYVALG
jgi:hypothetical protein